ncbi:hypothetical protein B7R25_10985 [Subtercola boreus]|uniref:AB hydrolase-1 domain-containing protein n=1 Tax=Subtercola boreus TaxID=120213 RepID=A0A3E0WBD1_9MICO|nr:hypothetical protein B7R24_10885 [Subtercola boreus]RFA19890.1 hypothetical protein B7R23_10865 [Subtercola boreus]RFA26283.1 hypothetical protein B7R25_10985 [Subtercola boreus]
MPDTDEVIGALIAAYPPTLLGSSLITRTFPAAGGSSPEVFIDESSFHAVFAADLTDTQVSSMAVSQRPIAAGAFAEPLTGIPAWKEVPSWFIVATEDRAIDPDSQRAVATRIGATRVEIQASHAVAVSNPARVADTIAEVVFSLASRKLVRS